MWLFESKYFRKMLMLTNNKVVKNMEAYTKVVKHVEIHFKEQGEVFPSLLCSKGQSSKHVYSLARK